MSFEVENDALQRALAAVTPHAYPKDDIPELSTVMFNLNERDELLLTASGGPTSAVAYVPLEDADGTLEEFALSVRDVRALQSVFPGEEQTIRFEHLPGEMPAVDIQNEEVTQKVRLGRLRITDVSGMIHGKQLQVRPADTGDRDVTKLWHEIAARFGAIRTVPRRTAVNSKSLALFKAAAAAYKEPLIVEMGDNRGNLIIRCGERFVGYLPATFFDQEAGGYDESARNQWKARLPMRLAEVRDGS